MRALEARRETGGGVMVGTDPGEAIGDAGTSPRRPKMQAILAHQTYRGVSCSTCGRPIRVRPAIVAREKTFQQTESGFTQEWCSKVFSHRCKRCYTEAVYSLDQLLDFEEDVSEQTHPPALP